MLKTEYKNFFENKETHWWHQGMSQINISLFKQYLRAQKNVKILDAGCGTGASFPSLQKLGEVTGMDISEDALKYARQRGRAVKGDVTSLPFKNGSFDLVVCFDVLYHFWVKDYQKALAEFHRVLKKDGLLLLREPAFEWLKSSHDLADMGKRRFSQKQLGKSLAACSFKVLKMSYANFFLFPLVFLKRLPDILGVKKKQAKSDIVKTPQWLNAFLLNFFKIEALLLRYGNLPIGSSVICLATKAGPESPQDYQSKGTKSI